MQSFSIVAQFLHGMLKLKVYCKDDLQNLDTLGHFTSEVQCGSGPNESCVQLCLNKCWHQFFKIIKSDSVKLQLNSQYIYKVCMDVQVWQDLK